LRSHIVSYRIYLWLISLRTPLPPTPFLHPCNQTYVPKFSFFRSSIYLLSTCYRCHWSYCFYYRFVICFILCFVHSGFLVFPSPKYSQILGSYIWKPKPKQNQTPPKALSSNNAALLTKYYLSYYLL